MYIQTYPQPHVERISQPPPFTRVATRNPARPASQASTVRIGRQGAFRTISLSPSFTTRLLPRLMVFRETTGMITASIPGIKWPHSHDGSRHF